MLELVQWLEDIERMAGYLYEDASAHFSDKGFSEFLARLARDESWHAHLMASAVDSGMGGRCSPEESCRNSG
ncbi:MAG: hypothetical protein ACYS5V_04365 [Planctomycetota bacterium]|jgi:ferritin